MKIAFVWQGISQEKIFNQWNDGLRVAIDLISKEHEVSFHEPWDDIVDVDFILYWEAPCTMNGQNAPHYNKVRLNPIKKALCFAGGPIKKEWVEGFDLLFLESKINEGECDALGIKWRHAFGINDKVFKYKPTEKKWDGMLQGTCASWKRQWLIGEALKEKGLLCGRGQDSDPYPFNKCREEGVTILPEQPAKEVAKLINSSHTVVNPCDYWGGGQRATLEAMACGVPVVCCTDSPKNREYIEESGFGCVVEPNASAIRDAVNGLKSGQLDPMIGVNYIKSKWTGKHYANQLLEGIYEIHNSNNTN